MTLTTILATTLLCLEVISMRGSSFHNHLVDWAASVFLDAGLRVFYEHPLAMADGRLNFVDLLVNGPGIRLACEIETTTRNMLVNVEKSVALRLPLWIVVPTRELKLAVRGKVQQVHWKPKPPQVHFSTPGEMTQVLTNYFPNFSAANTPPEKRKNTPGSDPEVAPAPGSCAIENP